MTSWSPGGVPDVLSHGGDPPSSRRGRVVAAAVALLAVGAALGGGVVASLRSGLPLSGEEARPVLTAGEVVTALVSGDRHRYQVSMYNPGPGTVRGVRVVAITGRAVTVRSGDPVDLPAGGWRRVFFSLPDECGSPADQLPRSLLVHRGGATAAADDEEQEVVLGEPATALRVNHTRECVAPTALGARELNGLWVLERVEGVWTNLAKIGLMRFTPDGRFAFDPEGQIFRDGRQGWFGIAGLHGRRLVLRGQGGYACPAGYTEWWATTRLAPGKILLENIQSDEGYCHTPPGERWTLRRVVPESRLPAARSRR